MDTWAHVARVTKVGVLSPPVDSRCWLREHLRPRSRECNIAIAADPTPLKVGFVMEGPINDRGWNYEVNRGRLYLESKFPNAVKTAWAEKVSENSGERVMERMIAQGNKLIFSTAFGYLEPSQRVAKTHPDVKIMQTQSTDNGKNLGA